MHRRVRLLSLLALTACLPADDPGASDVASGFADEAVPAEALALDAAEVDSGDFVVAYAAVQDRTFAQWQREFRRVGLLEGLAAQLNGWVGLPEDVSLTFLECGEPNAFYEPEMRQVSVCFEFVEHLDGVFAAEAATPVEHEAMVEDATVFITLHEVGHALVHLLDVPVTGREEDAVDGLATLMLLDGSPEGAAAAINGAVGLQDEAELLDELSYAGVHSLGPVRLANVLCWVYGQDPQTYGYLVKDGHLPAERADGCAEEYDQLQRSWTTLLGPYLKA